MDDADAARFDQLDIIAVEPCFDPPEGDGLDGLFEVKSAGWQIGDGAPVRGEVLAGKVWPAQECFEAVLLEVGKKGSQRNR